jgi:DNA-binding transcriptional LysR family regulator
MLGIWRLQLLREVARRGTVKAAAAAMSVTPSAVSQQIKILEAEAGVSLIEHHGRLIRLTEAGQMLVRHADTITAAIVAAESELAGSRGEVRGTLRIAAFPTAARAMLPTVIATLGRRHPDLRLMLRDLETHESLAALQMDEVDIAVVDEYDESTRVREAGVDVLTLLRDPIYLALPPGHAAVATPVPLADLRDEPWIMDTETSSIHQVALRACRRSGFDPHVRSNCRDYSVIIALVEAGLGVAVLPGLALRDRPIRARIVAADPPLERTVMAAVKPERRTHPAVAAMLAELEAFGRTVAP